MARRTFLLTYAVIFVSALIVSRDGQAENNSAKQREARTACLAGDYTQGVRLLSELFVSTKDPTFIYNQARCFEQNRRYEDAIGRFREYLRAGKNLSRTEQSDAEKHIADCKELIASEKPQAVPAPPVPVSRPEPEPVPAPETALSTSRQTATASGSSGLRTGGIVTASVGGAALVAGIVFNLKSNSLAQDLKKTDGFTSDKESDRKTYATLGWLGYGVGAACVATGAILYLLGSRSDAGGTVAFLPLFAPGQAGAVVKGAF
jgi:hypothetical protein